MKRFTFFQHIQPVILLSAGRWISLVAGVAAACHRPTHINLLLSFEQLSLVLKCIGQKGHVRRKVKILDLQGLI